VYSQLQSEQLRGTITFEQACRELHHRVESMKADDIMDGRSGRALISTEVKKHGQAAIVLEKVLCLAKDCSEMIQPYLPLCKLCYLQSMAGKASVLVLRDGFGNAVFNSSTKRLDFPPAVPKSRFPQKGLKKGRKVLMAGLPFLTNQDCAITDFSDGNVGIGEVSQDFSRTLTNPALGLISVSGGRQQDSGDTHQPCPSVEGGHPLSGSVLPDTRRLCYSSDNTLSGSRPVFRDSPPGPDPRRSEASVVGEKDPST
jgi:hypothetical protein